MGLSCDEISSLTAGDRIAAKDAEIARLKLRLTQAEHDRDDYKEQMIRAQMALHDAGKGE